MSKKIWTYVIATLCFIGGIFLLVKPEQSTSNIVYYLGLIMLVIGIFKVLSALIDRSNMLLPGSYLFSGILNVLFGIILMNNTSNVTKTISVIIGIWLIINAGSNLALALNYKKNSNIIDTSYIISNALKIILGIIVLTTPIIGVIFTGYFLGIILILIGIAIIYNDYRKKKVYKIKIK